MSSDAKWDVTVVGAGGAGTMAYLRGVLNADRTVLFTGDAESKRKGRSTWVTHVDNIPGMHGMSRPIGASTRSTLKWIAAQDDLEGLGQTISAQVERIERGDGGFTVHWTDRKSGEARSLESRFVVLATGVMDVQPEIDGSIKPILPFANRGDALYCVRCDGHKTRGHRLSILGATDSAIWIATMMADRYGHEGIRILTNGLEESISERALELARAYGIVFHREKITGVLEDSNGGGLAGFALSGGGTVETDRVIVSLGTVVHNQLLLDLGGDVGAKGKPILDDRFETTIPGVFAVGDLVPDRKMQVYTAWDEAVTAVDEINARLRSEKRAARLAALRAG